DGGQPYRRPSCQARTGSRAPRSHPNRARRGIQVPPCRGLNERNFRFAVGVHMNQKMWVLLMGVFLTAGTAASSPNPLEIYQRALVQEQAAGDLPEAMELYEQAAKEAGTDRGLAARALIRAAGCAEKLGQPAAA